MSFKLFSHSYWYFLPFMFAIFSFPFWLWRRQIEGHFIFFFYFGLVFYVFTANSEFYEFIWLGCMVDCLADWRISASRSGGGDYYYWSVPKAFLCLMWFIYHKLVFYARINVKVHNANISLGKPCWTVSVISWIFFSISSALWFIFFSHLFKEQCSPCMQKEIYFA